MDLPSPTIPIPSQIHEEAHLTQVGLYLLNLGTFSLRLIIDGVTLRKKRELKSHET